MSALSEFKTLLKLLVKMGMTVHAIKFVSAGLIGLAYSEMVLYLLIDLANVSRTLSIIFATETSLLLNFYINDRWTFGQVRSLGGRFVARFLKYHVSRLSSVLLNIFLFLTLTELFHVNYLFANVVAVIVAFMFNYVTSFAWVWKFHRSLKI